MSHLLSGRVLPSCEPRFPLHFFAFSFFLHFFAFFYIFYIFLYSFIFLSIPSKPHRSNTPPNYYWKIFWWEWVKRRLESGGRMEKVSRELEGVCGPVIYTDARASDTDACLGGFLAISSNLKECPWFSIMVDEEVAPWVKMKGCPKRVIASLEFLATLIAVKLWGSAMGKFSKAVTKAFTDNRGNSFALVKGMSTKFPLTVLLMEMAEELRQNDRRLDLEWINREKNVEADELSNGDWSKFDLRRREELDLKGKHRWKILDEMQKRGQELYEELKRLKEEKSTAKLAGGKAPRKGKVLAKWWVTAAGHNPTKRQIKHLFGLLHSPLGRIRHKRRFAVQLPRNTSVWTCSWFIMWMFIPVF